MTPNVYKERVRKAFEYADAEATGSLTKRQYKIAMTAVFGHCPEKVEIKHAFESTDRVSYEEFEHWVSTKHFTDDAHVNPEILFTLLDKDYKGYLVVDDFFSASTLVGLKISPSIWETVFKELDRHKKGYIDFVDFSRVLATVYKITAR
ncbi:PREDICTED: EF-hand calcium-binding domain-containing protein 11-like [Dufourea novaeangliae]|nr:PREDICTED: EF-hand calcium-binding domain-containing protein 11-like [Dufourea novaeangliae]